MLITPNTYPYQVLHVLRKGIIVGADRWVKTNKFQFFMLPTKSWKNWNRPLFSFLKHNLPDHDYTLLSCACACVCVTDQSDGVLWPQHSEHGLKMFLEVTWIERIQMSSFSFTSFWTTIVFAAFKGRHNTQDIVSFTLRLVSTTFTLESLSILDLNLISEYTEAEKKDLSIVEQFLLFFYSKRPSSHHKGRPHLQLHRLSDSSRLYSSPILKL